MSAWHHCGCWPWSLAEVVVVRLLSAPLFPECPPRKEVTASSPLIRGGSSAPPPWGWSIYIHWFGTLCEKFVCCLPAYLCLQSFLCISVNSRISVIDMIMIIVKCTWQWALTHPHTSTCRTLIQKSLHYLRTFLLLPPGNQPPVLSASFCLFQNAMW